MSTDLSLFHFDGERQSFEDLGKPNGATHWHEDIVRSAFGYQSDSGFEKALTRAKQACLAAGLECEDHFVRQPDGKYCLTRFGCYLVTMNGDPRKPQVAAAQAYFAALADTFQDRLEHADGIDRMLIREEITDGQKSLASTAKRHGVQNYAFFQNKGYMGMYNMSLERLSKFKGMKEDEKLIDRMGKEEMAAHLFRVTQTDAKIRKESIRGQSRLEEAAHQVGRAVRKAMIDLSSTTPESLPLAEDIREVRKKIKGTSRQMKALDGKKNPKRSNKKIDPATGDVDS
jgi:DNA-damage-inducible protein D